MILREFMDSVGIDFENVGIDAVGGSFLLRPMENSPLEFLMQAENDFESEGTPSLINSITNSKRAIVCQMDQLLLSFGYSPLNWNIPTKINKIESPGLLVPSVLRKVSRTRNLLEHEYVKPTKEQTEEGLDIASLFVMANVSLFNPFGDGLVGFEVRENEDNKYVDIMNFGLENNKNKICYKINVQKEHAYHKGYSISNEDPMFSALIKLALAFQLRYKVNEAFSNLDDVYNWP